MLFTSGSFLFVFLPVTLVGFFVLARWLGVQYAALWLTLASFFFYGFWAPEYILLLLASICLNYGAGGLIVNAATPQRSKTVLIAAITIDLGLLAYFKYMNFFAESVNGLFGHVLPHFDIVLPIGISFYTFTQIAYLVDTYRSRRRERNPIHYALFITYFPHLIAGPIIHHAQVMPQFSRPSVYRPALNTIVAGLAFLVIGLAKKVLIADEISPIANDAFAAANAGGIGLLHAWLGAVTYTFQLYFDFSGYSDMAVGISLLLGIKLPYNFDSPYKSANIIDFWRRWHQTLSQFLRDYLYFTLGGNRRGRVRRFANLLITMVLGGLWHGAAWTFVIWGALHGLYLIVNHAWHAVKPGLFPRPPGLAARRLGMVAGWLLTMLAVIVAWVFFRADSVDAALTMLHAMAGFATPSPTDHIETAPIGLLVMLAVMVRLLPNSQEIVNGHVVPRIEALRARRYGPQTLSAASGALCICTLLLAIIAASRTASDFIYFNF